MKLAFSWAVPVCLTLLSGVCAAQPGNLTGSWHLNVAKSHWGSTPKPHSVVLTIDHKEPSIQYQGSVIYANEDAREFGFYGAFDGKSYAMTRSFGSGSIVLKRIDGLTFDSVFTTEDGRSVEKTRTTLSRDGKILTREIRVQSPDGNRNWTEVYDRK